MLESSFDKRYVYFRIFCYTTVVQKSSLRRKEKILVQIMEHKLEEVYFDGIRTDVQLGYFILLSIPISQQLPRLNTVYLFSFLK